jgi:hypothetical protein
MTNIHQLLQQLEDQEKLLNETEFLAPCVSGGLVKTSVANMIYTFKTQPDNFAGWGIFKPLDNQIAEVINEANLPQIARYLQLLKPLRLRLAYQLEGQSWLAYPINEADMVQRFKKAQPVVIHLVTEGSNFESIIARFDGGNFWFEEVDRKAQVQPIMLLSEQLRLETNPDEVKFSGLTPEMLIVYDLAWQQTATGKRQRSDLQKLRSPKKHSLTPKERRNQINNHREDVRLENALKQGGGSLETYRDRGDFWQVEWRTSDGELHSSAINKNDLTVISSGICLSGKDTDFDLQSLVGVMEQQDYFD